MVFTYKQQFNKKYGFQKDEPHSLAEIAKLTGYKLSGLKVIYNKGIGAFKTNPASVRPQVKSPEQWAQARVYSAVMGGATARIDAAHLIPK
jgi:alkyl sulfatase BDS1-like metallo-beta-lactamase superfamily hydrolase